MELRRDTKQSFETHCGTKLKINAEYSCSERGQTFLSLAVRTSRLKRSRKQHLSEFVDNPTPGPMIDREDLLKNLSFCRFSSVREALIGHMPYAFTRAGFDAS